MVLRVHAGYVVVGGVDEGLQVVGNLLLLILAVLEVVLAHACRQCDLTVPVVYSRRFRLRLHEIVIVLA